MHLIAKKAINYAGRHYLAGQLVPIQSLSDAKLMRLAGLVGDVSEDQPRKRGRPRKYERRDMVATDE